MDFGAWRAIPSDGIFRVDLRIRPAAVDPRAVRRLVALLRADQVGSGAVDDVMDPRPSRALAGPLLRAALAADGERVTHLLSRLVGAGPGATPAGDDVIVGVLAGLDAATGSLLPGSAAHAARALLGDRLRPLFGRTTTISRHDLTAAIAGEFGEHVHLLVAALSDPAAAPAAVAGARNRGATSGVDLATGVAGSLAALVPRPTRRRTEPTPEPTPQRSSA
ncbi:DUF2877 domain-containing protein [Blastococcus capsensis]|uniref:oxamate carbamoyltransferase subunit AllH family protein n=1 Tax=Blastococcus capsensis TaxID=1564163 RepID=UPI002541DF12|nr:DUF2877 domain-containing protein [Blastococcus capsensis]MDK3258693.1 DUF2877 domain-containing protein [Blastococcus capsensis]